MIVWTRIARLGDGSAVWSPEAVANLVGQRPEGDLGRGREHVEILDARIVDGWVLVKLDLPALGRVKVTEDSYGLRPQAEWRPRPEHHAESGEIVGSVARFTTPGNGESPGNPGPLVRREGIEPPTR